MRRCIIFLAAGLVIFSLFCSALAEGVPQLINYQGKVYQPSGAPVPDGPYKGVFSIYDVPTGGTALWTETYDALQVKGSSFHVLLGSVNPIGASIFNSADRYLGVKLGNDPELSPRQKIASVPYAMVAEKVPPGSIGATDLAVGVATPPGSISMFGGGVAPAGWLMCDGSDIPRAAYPELFAVVGTTFGSGDGTTTFGLPDMRGVFPKGAGTTDRPQGIEASGSFYGAVLGVYSTDRIQGHRHDSQVVAGPTGGADQWCLGFVGNNPNTLTNYGSWKVLDPKTDGTNGTPRTGKTTEPQSLGLNYIIKW